MNDYFIEGTLTTPQIDGKISEGTLTISGKSLPEDTRAFYEPFIIWLQEFYKSKAKNVLISFEIEYYNTSTSNLFTQMLKQFQKMSETRGVQVMWFYEDDDIEMKEIGEDYQEFIGDILILKEKSATEWKDPFKPTEF